MGDFPFWRTVDLSYYKIYELFKCHIRRETTFGFGHLAHLPMDVLDRVGGVHQFADILAELKK